MKKIFYILVLFLIVITAACATKPVPPEAHVPNERIKYRDLTKPEPKRFKVPAVLDTEKVIPKKQQPVIIKKPSGPSVTNVHGIMPQMFIEFKNESYQLYDANILKKYIDTGDKSAQVVLIGHSHGKSKIGTLRLASKRAKVIQNILNERGFKKVHVMASWSSNKIDFTPNRGVHLYEIKKDYKNMGVPLVFVNNKEAYGNIKSIQTATFSDSVAVKDTKTNL